MSDELAKLKVVLEASMAPMKKVMQQARGEIKKTTESINSDMDKVKSPMAGVNVDKDMSKLRALQSVLKKIRAEYREKAGFPEEGLGNAILNGISQKIKNVQVKAGLKEYTEEYRQTQEDVDRTSKALEKLKQKQRDLDATGISHQSDEWKKLTNQITVAESRLERYEGRLSGMEYNGKDIKFVGFKNIAGAAVTKTFKGMAAVLSKVAPAIRKVSGAFGALLKRFASGIPGIRRLSGSMNKMRNSGQGMGGLFRTIGMSAKFMLASLLIRAPFEAMKAGMQNLAQYSGETNGSLSMLMSSLTQLKNAFAAAFAPILNVVAPILNFLIQKIVAVVNAIGQLFSALTGGKSFVSAKKVNQDYAASLNQNASGADKAGKANEKLQKTLLGFDQINKMDSGSESSGGSGGGAGGLSPADMFETSSIGSNVSEFANKIKEAWRTADFTEIGSIVGNKVNDALNMIPWDKIKSTSKKIAGSIATFLNGFIGSTDWKLVGSTIAEGLNTVFEFGYTFVKTFDWTGFGLAISDGINGAVSTFDWKKTAVTFSDGLKGLLDIGIASIENTDWRKLGESIKDAIVTIDWNGIVRRLFQLLGAALGGLAAFLQGLIGDAWEKVVNWWNKTARKDGEFTIEGLYNGIKDALSSVGRWIRDNIFIPFVNGFKNAFGIHSPSTVMAEQGRYIIDGIYQGLLDRIGKVLQWFRNLPGNIKTALGNVSSKMRSKGSEIISGMKDGFESSKNTLVTTVSRIPDIIRNSVGNLWNIGRNAINSFISGFQSLHIPTPHLSIGTNKYSIGGKSFSFPKINLKWYASGGFPANGEMFVAREAGPELVGRMGRKNAVANNDQIVDGIKAGVFEAVMDAFSAAGTMFGGNGEKQVFVELTLMCDSETIYKLSKKGKEKFEGRYSIVERI